MLKSLILSIICMLWGLILILQARKEYHLSLNAIEKPQKEEKEEEFSNRSLYFSNVALRNPEECYLRKKGIFEHMSPIARAECKTALYWILRYIDDVFAKDPKGFLTEEGKELLQTAMGNIQSMQACFPIEQVQTDLETVAKLFLHTIQTGDIGGVFYGHHILSDLNVWILDYPFDEMEAETWEEKPPKQREQRVFYGMAKTWEYPLTKEVETRIKTVTLPETVFDLQGYFTKKQLALAECFYTFSEGELELMLQRCERMQHFLGEIISLRGADIAFEEMNEMEQALVNQHGAMTKGLLRYYDVLLSTLEECIAFLPECVLQKDFAQIKMNLQIVYENQGNVDYPARDRIVLAKRMLDELYYFALPREINWEENHFYYGVTETMRDSQPDPVEEVEGMERSVAVKRDFFQRIIEKNGTYQKIADA